jgi:hypothetical protein
MRPNVRHHWIQQEGFRTDKCEHCNCIRKWDEGWKRIVYLESGLYLKLFTPKCRRLYFSDLIIKIK